MAPVDQPNPAADAPLSRGKKLLFGIIVAVVAAVVFFGGGELFLRMTGYGHSPRFYRLVTDGTGRRWARENRWVTAPYFPPELIRRPQVFRIPVPKPPKTYRIFVLGSSAAMGDPEPAFSISRMLRVMLQNAYPSIRFEVINAGITAINSNVVRPIARDCANLEPDLFIVYEGNNEVIGPYGPGTVFSPFLGSPFAIRLGEAIKATRTGQLAASLGRRIGSPRGRLKDWGGMGMFLQHEIDRDDPRLATTRRLFRENLVSIIDSGTKAGASVFLCTVLTNQKDFAPFQSRHRPGFTDQERHRWEELFVAGKKAAAEGDETKAEASFRAALAIDDHYAELPFQLARLYLRLNRLADAKSFFQQAVDLDVLRFRTDSPLNAIIRSLGNESRPGVEMVDLAADAERQSPQGILGDEYLYEHVHLNFQGTYVVARTLYGRIAADLIHRHLAPDAKPPEPMSMTNARYYLGYTIYEQSLIIRELRSRFGLAPFTAQSDDAERQHVYEERDDAATRILERSGARDGLVAIYEQALAANPGDWMLERNVGMAYVNLGIPTQALPHLEQAAATIPDDPDCLFALATAESKTGNAAAAKRNFAAVRTLEPNYPGLPHTRQ